MRSPVRGAMRCAIAAGALAATPPAWGSVWHLDLTGGPVGQVVRDEASSPRLAGGGGGVLGVRVALADRWRHEVIVAAEGAGLGQGLPHAGAAALGGDVAWRFLPRLGPDRDVVARVGPGLGLHAWTMDTASVLNDHRTWAFGTELSVVGSVEARLGPRDRLEVAGALPIATLVARPPWATTDEALRTGGPLAMAFGGRVGSLDAWARPQGTVRWIRDAGRVATVAALDVAWWSVADPEPLRGWFLGARAGARFGGGR